MRANFQYHSGGISGNRHPNSLLLEGTWLLQFPYDGGQFQNVGDDEFIAELATREPFGGYSTTISNMRPLSEFDMVQVTALMAWVMQDFHTRLEGFTQARKAINAIAAFFQRGIPPTSGLYRRFWNSDWAQYYFHSPGVDKRERSHGQVNAIVLSIKGRRRMIIDVSGCSRPAPDDEVV